MSPHNTRDKFRQLLKTDGTHAMFRINPVGRIYDVTFVDHNSGIVINGSEPGKEFSANLFNDLYSEPKEIRQVAEQCGTQTRTAKPHGKSRLGHCRYVLDMADTRVYEEHQRMQRQRRKKLHR